MYDVVAIGLVVTFVYPVPLCVERYTLYPTADVEPELQLRLELCETAVEVPVPDQLIDIVGFVALLCTVRVPLKLLALVGVNTAVNVADPPPAIVTGAASPEVENAALLLVSAEIVALAVPVLEIVTLCVELEPTATLPMASVVVLVCNVAVPDAAVVPVPDQLIDKVEFVALL